MFSFLFHYPCLWYLMFKHWPLQPFARGQLVVLIHPNSRLATGRLTDGPESSSLATVFALKLSYQPPSESPMRADEWFIRRCQRTTMMHPPQTCSVSGPGKEGIQWQYSAVRLLGSPSVAEQHAMHWPHTIEKLSRQSCHQLTIWCRSVYVTVVDLILNTFL